MYAVRLCSKSLDSKTDHLANQSIDTLEKRFLIITAWFRQFTLVYQTNRQSLQVTSMIPSLNFSVQQSLQLSGPVEMQLDPGAPDPSSIVYFGCTFGKQSVVKQVSSL